MSTYACWRLWAGIRLADLNYNEISLDACYLISAIREEPHVMEGLKVEYISLPEESGGVGVVVMEHHWRDAACTFDTKKITHAKTVVTELQDIFRRFGIVAKVALMHHIDLGG